MGRRNIEVYEEIISINGENTYCNMFRWSDDTSVRMWNRFFSLQCLRTWVKIIFTFISMLLSWEISSKEFAVVSFSLSVNVGGGEIIISLKSPSDLFENPATVFWVFLWRVFWGSII